MSFIHIQNVKLKGLSACAPERVVTNTDDIVRSVNYNAESFVKSTGVGKRHLSNHLTTSDLCYKAAEKLLTEMGWERKSIDALIFVSQSPDYLLPATSCILQDRLQLSKDCFCEDVSMGCSGWIYGLSTLSSLLSTGEMKRGLLLVGDAKKQYPADDPLFGYAGCVTAVEYEKDNEGFYFNFGTDGSGYDDIILPEGGSRMGLSPSSFRTEHINGKDYSRLETRMKGMEVFLFATSAAPRSVKRLYEKYGKDMATMEYLVLHQSNLKMLTLIRTMLRLPVEKVPISLDEYGNTSSASIPMTIVSRLGDKLNSGSHSIACCGFGVGLSWGSVLMTVDNLVLPDVLTMKEEEADTKHLA